MPAINFKEQFAELVKSDKKRQTIRRVRKRPIVKGDVLYLYTGQRTKNSRSLGVAVCEEVIPITILSDGIKIDGSGRMGYLNYLNDFAQADGFEDWKDMIAWFDKQYKLPFEGVLIQW